MVYLLDVESESESYILLWDGEELTVTLDLNMEIDRNYSVTVEGER